MPVPDLFMPVIADGIASFGDGAGSPSSKINYDVPLPGAYETRHITPLTVPPEWFVEFARRAGSSLLELGVIQGDQGVVTAVDAQRLAEFYRRALPASARPSLRLVADVGGNVQPLLAALSDHEKETTELTLDQGLLPRRRVISEPEDVDIQRVRRDSYIDRLASLQSRPLQPPNRVRLTMPIPGPGHCIQHIQVDPAPQANPQLALVETWELRSYLGDYGLGRTLQTFSLLPGERTTITIESWRSEAATREDATSIFDSSDIAAQTRFANSIAQESGSAFQDQGGWSMSVATSASVSANLFGIVGGSASIEAGFAANHQEASQRWSSSMSQAASEHATQVNNSRQQAVQSSSSTTTQAGTATTTVRELSNTNLRRVLNFVFRELNQEYETVVVLRDISVAFFNGNPGSLDMAPLADLRGFLAKHVSEDHREEAARFLLGLCAERLGPDDDPVATLQFGRRTDGKRYTWADARLNGDGELDFDANPLSTDYRWRFKPGPLNEGDDEREIDGLVTSKSSIVLRTDNLVVEALLGQADALDPYAAALQALDLTQRDVENRKIGDALAIIRNIPDDDEKISAWVKLFPDEPEIEVVPVASVHSDGNGDSS